MWSPAVALPGLGPRGGPLSQPCLEPDSLCPSALCFPASGLGASQSQQVLNLFLRDCLRLCCPCVPKLEPASRPSSGWPEHCSALLFQGRGQWGRGLAPSPSPDALPKIASLLLPAAPWRPGSEAAFVRSEVQLGWALWASRPTGRPCAPSQRSSPEPKEALPGPQSWGRLQRLLSAPAVGRTAQNGDWRWKSLEINSQVEGLGRRPLVRPEEAPIPKKEREAHAQDSGASQSEGKEET